MPKNSVLEDIKQLEKLKKMAMDRNFYRRKWSLAVASPQRIWSANE